MTAAPICRGHATFSVSGEIFLALFEKLAPRHGPHSWIGHYTVIF